MAYPGIIDQNGRVTMIPTDRFRNSLEIIPRRDIGLVEGDTRR